MSEQQETKFYVAMKRYYDAFKVHSYFDGMSHDERISDQFITKLNQAVDNSDPEIDLNGKRSS